MCVIYIKMHPIEEHCHLMFYVTTEHLYVWFSFGYGVERHFQQYFSYIVMVSFIGWGNRSTQRNASHNVVLSTPCQYLYYIYFVITFLLWALGGGRGRGIVRMFLFFTKHVVSRILSINARGWLIFDDPEMRYIFSDVILKNITNTKEDSVKRREWNGSWRLL